VTVAPKPDVEHRVLQVQRRLARNVRALRLAKNLTVKEAADRVRLHWRHWQKLEAGEVNPTLRTFAQIIVALEVDPRDLLCPKPPRGSEKPARTRRKKKTAASP
jgi:transcriptional regulator with XRE-family HTH domain